MLSSYAPFASFIFLISNGTISYTSPDDAICRDIEYRRFRVFVYRDDYVRGLHADEMLHCAGYAAGDIYLRANCLSCLTHLMPVRYPAFINSSPRRADSAAEDFCKFSIS